ncbi:amidohydrolase family protein [Patescibacteria group bacterium]|nr:amidohydrolase family protein [Patescibacteria group bacterium]
MRERFIKIPGLIDTHVHFRDPGETHKEDFYTGTSAALAGGVVCVIDMPNNKEPITTLQKLKQKEEVVKQKAVCDYGFYFGTSEENSRHEEIEVLNRVVGLKMYLNLTHGALFVSNLEKIKEHFASWPKNKPLLVHAEEEKVSMVLSLLKQFPRRVHFCHISLKEEIEQIKKAKESGLPITCEVTPHHLFLTEEDEKALGPFGRVNPPLRTSADIDALWKNLDVIDIIVSDHAPHTKEEKLSSLPPPGVPGVETTLSLLLVAVSQGKLSLERLVDLTSTNPAKIFNLSSDHKSWVEVDITESYLIENENLKTKCGWSPFEGKRVTGRVRRVFLRGQKVYEDGKVLVKPSFGKNICQ